MYVYLLRIMLGENGGLGRKQKAIDEYGYIDYIDKCL